MDNGAAELPSKAAAALLQITQRRLQQLCKEGWIPAGKKRGHFPLVGLVQGYIQFLRDENERRTNVAGETDLKQARRREIELRMARQDREIITLEEAVACTDKMAGEFLQSIGGLPARITRAPRERKRLEAIIDKERERLAARFDKIGETLQTGVDADEAGAKVDAG